MCNGGLEISAFKWWSAFIDLTRGVSLCKGGRQTAVVCFTAQNEEVLKKCAQEYLARVKQEEQRYQTLKIHAEEKLDKYVKGWREILHSSQVSSNKLNIFTLKVCLIWCLPHRANEEIAQVRAKANSDNMALTASLRKEQMKNESLEQALQQKVPAPFFYLPAS